MSSKLLGQISSRLLVQSLSTTPHLRIDSLNVPSLSLGTLTVQTFSTYSDASPTFPPTPGANPTGNPALRGNSRHITNPNPVLNPNPAVDVDPTTNLHATLKHDPLSNRDLTMNQQPIENLGSDKDPSLDASDRDQDQREPSNPKTEIDPPSSKDPFPERDPPLNREPFSKQDPPKDRDPPPKLTNRKKTPASEYDPTRKNSKGSPSTVDPTQNKKVTSAVDPTKHNNPTASFDPTRKLHPNANTTSKSASNSSMDPSRNTQPEPNIQPHPTAAFDPTRATNTTTTNSKRSTVDRTQPFTTATTHEATRNLNSNTTPDPSFNINPSQSQSKNQTSPSQPKTQTTEKRKVIVFGGNGFVGSHICQNLVESGNYQVLSINRSGKPAIQEDWVDQVEWISADVFDTKSWVSHLQDTYAIISCLGAFAMGKDELERLNGDTTLVPANLSLTAEEGKNVKKFVFISATQGTEAYTKLIPFLSGYLEGKRKVENFLLNQWAPARSKDSESSVTILRPGFIYGPKTVQVANQPVELPLHWLGRPLEMLLTPIWSRLSNDTENNRSSTDRPSSNESASSSPYAGEPSPTTVNSKSSPSWTEMMKMMSEPPVSVESVAASAVEALSSEPLPGLSLTGILDVKTMNENFSRLQQRKQRQE